MGAVWRGDGFGQILCLFSSLNWKRKLYNLHFLFKLLNLSDKAYFCKVIVHTHLDKMIAEYTRPNNVWCYLQNNRTHKWRQQGTDTKHTYNAYHAWSQVKEKKPAKPNKKGWLLWSLARLMLTTQVVGCSLDTHESDEVT